MADHLENVEVKRDGRIAVLRLNRPDRLNAISVAAEDEIRQVLDELAVDDGVRSVVLAGNGRAFSSGYDLGAEVPADVEGLRRTAQTSDRFASAVWRFPKPLIAAVHGYCLGGACEAAMLCDITVAGESATFGEPEIRMGTGSTLIMPWLVPMKIAKELLLGGSLISAQRAYEIGMVNRVVPDDQIMDEAMRFAGLFARVAPPAVQFTKRGINAAYERAGMWQAIAYHTELVTHMMLAASEERRTFDDIAEKDGLRAALSWRDGQFAPFDE